MLMVLWALYYWGKGHGEGKDGGAGGNPGGPTAA